MKKSTVWLMVGIGSVVVLSVLACCTIAAMNGDSSFNGNAAATADVDLEKLTKEFEVYVNNGSQDLNGFEQAINDKTKAIYSGTGHVDVTMLSDGGVMGYVNKDADPTYKAGADEKVFELQVAKEEQKVVARDRHDRYYSYHPTGSGFFTGYLVGSMLSNQRTYYPAGSYYRAPTNVKYQSPGYHSRLRSSSSSSSFRSGSRSSFRSSSRSGGFGSGK